MVKRTISVVHVEPTGGLRGAESDRVEKLVPRTVTGAPRWIGGRGAALAPWTRSFGVHDAVAQPEASHAAHAASAFAEVQHLGDSITRA